ncbi:MAG TPA: thiamine pyrophosphate-dependent enzyme [Chloroflexota bacterium]|nr:thiamine pyrophosphate-dependent enzyme [Chloroflexota bacterium]
MDGLALYRWMALSRALERALCARNPRWFPAEGEEATVVGAFCDLRADDVAAPHYRGPFAAYLMRGAELWRLCAQAFGKAAGYNRGRSVPFTGPFALGFVPWVAGDLGTTIGVATGAALALQQEGGDRVCVCSFGDGTANRGDVHESLVLAATWRLPIVYVCQNNGWSISQPAETYLPAPIVDRAAGYGIPGASVDGNDVEAVREAVGASVARARRGEGPSLVEARTWRVGGHWAGDDLAYRSGGAPPAADPLELLAGRLRARGEAVDADLARIRSETEREVGEAIERALALPDAGPDDLGIDEVLSSPLPVEEGGRRPGEGPPHGAVPAKAAARLETGPHPNPLPLGEGARRITLMEAVVEAIAQEMRRDGRVLLLGQDVGAMGGPLQSTSGLLTEFGPKRIRETPIVESAMVGAGIGAALLGRRPIVEVSFGEFLPCAMNQLVLQAPNLHYMTAGAATCPVVIRTRVGDGPYRGHPQDYTGLFVGVPGWTVVVPATPADAKGLMAAAIRHDGPVLFVEPMGLAHAPRGGVPAGEWLVPIGRARVARAGRDTTVVAYGSAVPLALDAAARLAGEGVEAEVIDLRTLVPWDRDAVLESVGRTNRLVIAHETWPLGGVGAEIAATVAAEAIDDLAAPILRVGARPVPIPSGPLRQHALPRVEDLLAALRRVLVS